MGCIQRLGDAVLGGAGARGCTAAFARAPAAARAAPRSAARRPHTRATVCHPTPRRSKRPQSSRPSPRRRSPARRRPRECCRCGSGGPLAFTVLCSAAHAACFLCYTHWCTQRILLLCGVGCGEGEGAGVRPGSEGGRTLLRCDSGKQLAAAAVTSQRSASTSSRPPQHSTRNSISYSPCG